MQNIPKPILSSNLWIAGNFMPSIHAINTQVLVCAVKIAMAFPKHKIKDFFVCLFCVDFTHSL